MCETGVRKYLVVGAVEMREHTPLSLGCHITHQDALWSCATWQLCQDIYFLF